MPPQKEVRERLRVLLHARTLPKDAAAIVKCSLATVYNVKNLLKEDKEADFTPGTSTGRPRTARTKANLTKMARRIQVHRSVGQGHHSVDG